nr:unnamed protein product [Spirometra erinaceieuropaei]
MRGAETGNAHESDHVLVRTRLKVNLSSATKMPRSRQLDVEKIRQTSTAEALSREIQNRLTTRADGECHSTPRLSEGEVVDVIQKLRNNKAPVEDGIPAETFKSCVDTLAPWLHGVIERAWRDEVGPDDWGLGILALILKKGDKTRCENYRGISLIDVAAKIFAIVLLRRFQAVRDSRTRPNQAGFRAGRGCADQIFTLRRILKFRHSHQQTTAVCFIDFAAAFDSVHRESL